ncbi:MAG: protein-L-isoaspartate O-methyltransferase [Desulfobulbaceae bacterium]|nr:MAG: protein-L-isoaspartate O-methyltransferase [Desulfobulbaceae bacterium]
MLQREIQEMLHTIEVETRLTQGYTGLASLRPGVMEAMARVPRHQFVPDYLKPHAYANGPLPIGNGQTISQPFIVALMTDLLCPTADSVMLEVGAGSGYQAAVLSLLIKKLYSVEIIADLAHQAEHRLQELGFHNVEVHQGDGYLGWPTQAPYDGIIVTAAADHVPAPLQEQLRPGGRLVIPVGPPHRSQQLLVIEKKKDNTFTSRNVLDVAFVPLTGSHDEGKTV